MKEQLTPVKEMPWTAFGGDALRRILDASPTGILITDADERILWINRTLRRDLDVAWPAVLGEGMETLPLERVEDFLDGRERYRILSGIPGEDEMLDASVSTLDDGSGGELRLRYFIHHIGQGLRASLLQHLGARRGTDPLSGVMDKEAIMRLLDSEISRTRRYSNTLSILVLKVDSKAEDDDHDIIMAAAGRLLSDGLRWVDAVGRIGDSEFLLVLPETDAEGARVLAKKLKARFREPNEDLPPLKAKLATASWRKGDDSKFMLDRAESRLGGS